MSVLINMSRNRYSVNEKFFDNPLQWSQKEAYWFGWLVTDGTNDKYGRAMGLRIAEGDIDVLRSLKDLISYTGPIRIENRDKVTSICGRPITSCQNRAAIMIYNRSLSEAVKQLGIRSGKGGSFVPIQMNTTVYHHYVRALFEGNGCFSFSRCNKFESNLVTSPFVIQEVRQWLNKHGINSHITDGKDGPFANGAKVLRVCGNNAGMKLFLLLYRDSTYRMARKLDGFIRLYHYKKTTSLKRKEAVLFDAFQTAILPYAT